MPRTKLENLGNITKNTKEMSERKEDGHWLLEDKPYDRSKGTLKSSSTASWGVCQYTNAKGRHTVFTA